MSTQTEAEAILAREDADAKSQKMSGKVRIQRWPSDGPVVGPALMMVHLDKAAGWLYESNFMRPWIESKIKEHLLLGGAFVNRGRGPKENEAAGPPNGEQISVRVRSEYRVATELEVLNWVDNDSFAASGKTVSKRAQEKGYLLNYQQGARLIEAYENLPRQAREILDILNEAGREQFTEASIQVLLEEKPAIERLKTKQAPMLVWGFYRKRMLEEGHLEEIDASSGTSE